jgi:hypothetical protein
MHGSHTKHFIAWVGQSIKEVLPVDLVRPLERFEFIAKNDYIVWPGYAQFVFKFSAANSCALIACLLRHSGGKRRN